MTTPRRRWAALAAVLCLVVAGVWYVVREHRTPRTVTAPPSRVAEFHGAPTVAFVGDSYSWGAAASSASKRWTSLVCASKHWNEENVAIPGMGYVAGAPTKDYAAQMHRVAASHPSLIVMSGGWNDVAHRYPVTKIVDGLRHALDVAKREMPGVPVVVIAPIGPDKPPPTDLVKLRDAARSVVTNAGAQYVDLDFPLTGHPEWISPDGLHPNDAGYAHLAEITAPKLPAVG